MSNFDAEHMLKSLPSVLQKDEKTEALAEMTAEAMEARVKENEKASVYINIDLQEEELLDILAKDFKVDWWSADYTLEEKRDILKNSWNIHRLLGTKAAVELAINSLYEEASVAEWFEYDGDPYHFRVIIHSDETIADSTKLLTVISKILYYKNLRSTLDDILFTRTHEMPMRYVGTAVYASTYTTLTLDTVIDPTNYNWLQDEQSVMLLDEMGDVLLNDA